MLTHAISTLASGERPAAPRELWGPPRFSQFAAPCVIALQLSVASSRPTLRVVTEPHSSLCLSRA